MEFKDTRQVYANIATLYYLGEITQEDIAETYDISRYKVSRILKRCKAEKIVEFRINNKPAHFHKLQEQLMDLFKLKQVIITQSGPTNRESKINVGKAAAHYLEDHLEDGMLVGFSWGTTVQEIVNYYNPSSSYNKSVFIQISGNICSNSICDYGYKDGREIIKQLAEKANAGWSLFQVPYVVTNKLLKKLLCEDPEIKEHLAKMANMDMVIVGIGSIKPEESVTYRSGYITLEESKQLVSEGAGQDICGIRLKETGELVSTLLKDRVLSIDAKTLKKVPDVVAIGAGTEKANSLLAGTLGGYFDRLILDEVAALSMLNLYDNRGTK